ncbi:MAG: hypothetical protein WA160_15275 [Pseudobdellovibrio sp.]
MNLKNNFVMVSGVLLVVGLMSACATNKNKAEKIETKVENAQAINGETSLGVKDGNVVVQKKVLMNEELRKIQYDVYESEDHVYGNRKYGSLGLYGVLRDCKLQLSDPKNGGDGKLIWTEPIDRVTDKEEDFKIGIDEEKKLVGVNEEFLNDRIVRFKGYKNVLNKRADEYEEKVAICKSELNARKSKTNTTN